MATNRARKRAQRRIDQQGDPKAAIAYVRVSTADQALGPEAQRTSIEAWAKQNLVTVFGWHEDRGVSGSSEIDDRPGLVAALAEMKASRAGLLIVAKRDRMARDVFVACAIERAVQCCGGRVICADGLGNGDDPAEQLVGRILDAVAEFERKINGQRTKAALAAKRALGFRSGNLPYGYSADPSGRLVENPSEREVIRSILELRRERASFSEIVASLTERGYRGRTGRPFSPQQVYSIWKNTWSSAGSGHR
jgi:site-specific DNA recombinase